MGSVDLELLAEGCAELSQQRSQQGVLDALVLLAGRLVPGCDHASVSVLGGGRGRTVAASHEVARALDGLQYLTGEGPCLLALTEPQTVVVGDVSQDRRWPALRRAVVPDVPVRSIMAVPLVTGHGVRGSLNAMSSSSGAFAAVSQQLAAVLAVHATAVLTSVAAPGGDRDWDAGPAAENGPGHGDASFQVRLAGEMRTGLMALSSAAAVLLSSREQLDGRAQKAVDLLADELLWHEQLSLELLRGPPSPDSGEAGRQLPPRVRSRAVSDERDGRT